MQRLLDTHDRPVTVAISHKSDYDADDMKVELDGCRLVKIGKDLLPDQVDGESIGMILFQPRSPGAGVVMGCFPATVAASASILFEDVVLTSFGGRSNAGAIGVYSDISPLVVMSRTYNQGDQGTFGQTIPGRTADQAIPENARAVLVQLHENGIYRSNIGAFNTTDSSAVVTIDLYTSQGTHLGNHRINLGPYDWEQVNRIFSKVTSDPVTNGRAEITLSGGPVLVYASVVDELTSDPSYIEPQILVGS